MNDPFFFVKLHLRTGDHLNAMHEMGISPKRLRHSVPAIELSLKVFTGLENFELCELAAQILLDDLVPSEDALESIANFRLAQARSRVESDDLSGAKQSVKDALKRWPPIREVVESDRVLASLERES